LELGTSHANKQQLNHQQQYSSGAAPTAPLLTPLPSHPPPGQDDTTLVKERLHQVFSSYATFGAGQAGSAASSGLAKAPELDSSRFAKLVREAGLLDKAFDLTSADLVFAKVGGVGQHSSCHHAVGDRCSTAATLICNLPASSGIGWQPLQPVAAL
jgi:hypothetical protein